MNYKLKRALKETGGQLLILLALFGIIGGFVGVSYLLLQASVVLFVAFLLIVLIVFMIASNYRD